MRRLLLLALGVCPVYADTARIVRHVTVYSEPGRFGGWPANHGIWSWGNEILVGFSAAWFQYTTEDRHMMDRSKPEEPRLARSRDGGITWTIEAPPSLASNAEPTALREPMNFTDPDFAMKLRLTDTNAGPSRFWYSTDRGHTWKGPFRFPLFGQKGIAARTDYIALGPRDCLVFLTASKSNAREGRPLCARTSDGGLNWLLVSWIGPEPEGFSIMPSTIRLPLGRLVTVVRRREATGTWIDEYTSDDNGEHWTQGKRPVESNGGHSGNPPHLMRLRDGRLCLTYGYRDQPYSIRARLSENDGQTWGSELTLRQGSSWDLGYVRSAERPDGRIVSVYYFNAKADKERTIEATVWEPPPSALEDEEPPVHHGMRIEELLAAREADEVKVSPDGATILFTVSSVDLAANRSSSRLMLWSGGAAREVPGAPEGAGSIRWSTDGKRVAFIARKDGKNAVWVLDPASGAITRVCDYDRGNSFLSKAGNPLAWSPDGTQLAFAGTLDPAPPAQDPRVIDRILYKTRTSLSDDRRSHIYVVPAAGGTPRAITPGNYDEHSIDWGANGEIVFLSNRGPNPDLVLNYDIYAINPGGGATRQITKTPGVEMTPRVSPDGRWIAYTATTRPITTIDSVAEDAHVWVIPMAGGQAKELNRAVDRRSTAPDWMPDSKSVIYTLGDHGKTPLYRTTLDGASTALVDRAAQVSSPSVARDGTIAFAMTDPVTPREVFRLRGGSVEQITQTNSKLISVLRLSRPETVRFLSFDGAEVEGWLYPSIQPFDESSERVPLILSIHGGPHGMHGYAFNSRFQFYAARGFATLALNPRGSSGYGQNFSDGCVNNWGGGDYRDLMAGVDYALKKYPQLDAQRMAVTGGSYGGFMTNWVVTQTNRFKAAVAVASLSNLVSFYATSLYQDLIHTEFGGFPWDDDHFALLWKWSPLAHIRNATTPTLLLHGENDNDVHITQAEEMYTALRMRGIEAELVRYPREGHGFREPKHQIDAARRTVEWIERRTK